MTYDPKTVNLHKRYYPKLLRWAIDQDYLDKLSRAELEWLSKFLNEYYKGAVKKSDTDALHHKRERDCYNRSKAMQRDLYSLLEADTGLKKIDSAEDYDLEGILIDAIDRTYGPSLRVVKGEKP